MSGIRSRWITGDGRQGLVFGYGLIREERIERGRRAAGRGDRGGPGGGRRLARAEQRPGHRPRADLQMLR